MCKDFKIGIGRGKSVLIKPPTVKRKLSSTEFAL